MSYQNDTYARIKAEFTNKYRKAQNKATLRSMELHEKIPEVMNIDRQLSMTGMAIMEVITHGKDTEQKIGEIRARNEELLAKRAELLRANGYPENYSDVQYECPKCGDTICFDESIDPENLICPACGEKISIKCEE